MVFVGIICNIFIFKQKTKRNVKLNVPVVTTCEIKQNKKARINKCRLLISFTIAIIASTISICANKLLNIKYIYISSHPFHHVFLVSFALLLVFIFFCCCTLLEKIYIV